MSAATEASSADELEFLSSAAFSAWVASDRTDTELARIAREATDELLRQSGRPCHAAFLASIEPINFGGAA